MRKIVKLIISLSVFLATIVIILYGVAYILGNPDLTDNRYLKLYDDNQELYYQSVNNYSGQYVSLDDVSDDFLQSIVSIEDKRFYQHHGFDYIGIIRAIKSNLTNSKIQGASTISQQYARLLYLTNEKTYSRKVKEAFLTMQLETHLSKDKILEGYINNVYFGHGIYGIENASKYYYDKSAKDLDLNESSMLAGVVNGPSYFSPLINKANAKKRQKVVLDALYDQHKITKSQKDTVINSKLNLASTHQIDDNMSTYYYRDTVVDELEELGYYNNKYLNKGLNVHTTLKQDYQDQLNQTIKDLNITSKIQTSFIITQPKTSKVQAIIGGKDYNESQFNRATKCTRQIGSTIKPLLYYTALENGFDPTTKFMCEPTTFKLDNGSTYTPSNFNNKYAYQEITLAQAIAVSDNIYAVKTHLFLGCDTLANFIKQYNLPTKNNASLALGTLNTNIYNLADIYNSFANLGTYNHIYTIDYIEDHEGNIIYKHNNKSSQILNSDTCLVLSKLLTGTFNKQFSTYLSATMSNYDLDYEVACKTGSTDYDNLVMAYTPDILVGGWVGYDDNSKISDSNEKKLAKEVTVKLLDYSNSKKKHQWYKASKNIEEIKINPLTGENDENGIVYWFKKQ